MKSLWHKLVSKFKKPILLEEPIHEWFGLSYCSYLVLPRSILQSLPVDLQKRLINIMDEIETIGYECPLEGEYFVQLRDSKGRFMEDYFRDYERGRRKVFPNISVSEVSYFNKCDYEQCKIFDEDI